MGTPRSRARLDNLIWTLIFGGLLAGVLGLATLSRAPAKGWVMVVAGFGIAAVGAGLILVRARLPDDPPS